jgi:WD40 repeat protein
MHPLLREFVYEKVKKERNQDNLKSEVIINLKNKYYDDFSYLVDEYKKERDTDIDSLLDDFKVPLEWSSYQKWEQDHENGQIITSIYSLYKILEQESHNLRSKDKNSFISTLPNNINKQLVFAQQIHIRSTELSDVRVMEKSKKYIEREKNSFVLKWVKVKDKSTLIRTLEGHASSVESVAIRPDGTKILSGSVDCTIKIWDLVTSRLLNTMEGHTGVVRWLAVTPDGTKIVSASEDKTIKIWDLASGRLLNTLKGHTSRVLSVAVTPDGTNILSGSWDHTIRVWDLNRGSSIFSCKFDSTISTIALSKNKNIMAIGDSNGEIYAINLV